MTISRFLRTAAAVGLAAGIGSFAASKAFADTDSDTMDIDASVVKNCQVTTAPVSFAAYDVFALTDTDDVGGVTIACTRGVSATIALSGSNATRAMTGPNSATLTYGLYQNSGRTTAWDATNVVTYASTSRAATALPVYARIPKDQDVPVGAYTDEVTATINF